jgi:hypothetical protein
MGGENNSKTYYGQFTRQGRDYITTLTPSCPIARPGILTAAAGDKEETGELSPAAASAAAR